MKSVGIVWAQWGPYHFARFRGLCGSAGSTKVHGIELSNKTGRYSWTRGNGHDDLITLCPDAVAEQLPFSMIFRSMRRKIAELGIGVCLLPSYSPKQSLAALLAAKSMRIRTVMMNETHAGTARARGLQALVKRQLVSLFDAAVVGGRPHQRYFASLGLPMERIFTAYDAVDNDYFSRRTAVIKAKGNQVKKEYGLPDHYFLSLGRFIPKKNLNTLIRAYKLFLERSGLKETHLVLVGSGEEETSLKCLCHNLGLPVYDKKSFGGASATCGMQDRESNKLRPGADELPVAKCQAPDCQRDPQLGNGQPQSPNAKPGVHFYGFRQIDENPTFYALADAFILPSLWEEWGLVVNEAMASGLPVVVSETAGCAEDLLETGFPPTTRPTAEWTRARELQIEHRLRQNGLVFDPKATGELSRILLVLESSADLRTAMAAAGRRIVSKFSCEKFGENALRAAQAAVERHD